MLRKLSDQMFNQNPKEKSYIYVCSFTLVVCGGKNISLNLQIVKSRNRSRFKKIYFASVVEQDYERDLVRYGYGYERDINGYGHEEDEA